MISSVRSKAMEKILVVGAGMTGASVVSLLRQELPKSSSLTLWDKSNGIGGRMSTSRSNKCKGSTVDLGAQYISATPEYQQKHEQMYTELLDAAIFKQIDVKSMEGHQDKQPGLKHYVVPNGISSLVKYFVNKSGSTVERSHQITSVSKDGNGVKVTTDQGLSDTFDAIVLTMPVPQILQLKGDIPSLIDGKGIRSQLEEVSYSSRFAVGLYFTPDTVLDVPWAAKYITGNPCVRYVAIDSKKRGNVSSDVGPSICVHTSAPWGLEHVEMDKDEAAQEILAHLKQVLPWLPEPAEVKGHKWRYSQVHKGYHGSPGCIVLSESPAILLAGDGFTHSNFDGCLESSLAVHKTLTGSLQSKV
ncbi:renalase-like [Mya arenaria]|uniref:renalase-like n=1 Tax=Mya arenaria TaxID=6604 RepID=UPI0022E14AB3|nr:renalase-like [Mya arenaria]